MFKKEASQTAGTELMPLEWGVTQLNFLFYNMFSRQSKILQQN